MLIGTATVFLDAHQSVSYGIGAATILGRHPKPAINRHFKTGH
jgi:hypothetical protein